MKLRELAAKAPGLKLGFKLVGLASGAKEKAAGYEFTFAAIIELEMVAKWRSHAFEAVGELRNRFPWSAEQAGAFLSLAELRKDKPVNLGEAQTLCSSLLILHELMAQTDLEDEAALGGAWLEYTSCNFQTVQPAVLTRALEITCEQSLCSKECRITPSSIRATRHAWH